MKQLLVCGTLLHAWFFICISQAQAAPYFGFDANNYSISLKDSASDFYPQSVGGLDLHVGDRIGALAGEIGYGTSMMHGNSYADNLRLTLVNMDGLFYLPIAGGLNLLLTAGGSETNYGISSIARNYFQDSQGRQRSNSADVPILGGNEFDWRAGAGFSFGLDEFELRAVARYQPLSMGNVSENAFSVAVGLNMYF
jgi:hypothetical protein